MIRVTSMKLGVASGPRAGREGCRYDLAASRALVATFVENAIRVGISTAAAGAGYGGYLLGSALVESTEDAR